MSFNHHPNPHNQEEPFDPLLEAGRYLVFAVVLTLSTVGIGFCAVAIAGAFNAWVAGLFLIVSISAVVALMVWALKG